MAMFNSKLLGYKWFLHCYLAGAGAIYVNGQFYSYDVSLPEGKTTNPLVAST